MDKPSSGVCDCLSQDCDEKRHSNRRQFLEQYYNSRTQLSPTSNSSASSFNISTPLNRLSECDAITRRLLSSPNRNSPNQKILVETTKPVRRLTQMSDIDKSRRASLGTSSMTDQLCSFSTSRLKSLDSNFTKRNVNDDDEDDLVSSPDNRNAESDPTTLATATRSSADQEHLTSGEDLKLKQQQGRSLSVCDEETLNPRLRSSSSVHSSNLNRAISLACESASSSLSTTKRLSTLIPLFGCDIKSLEQFTEIGLILPPVINSAVDHILANGINSIGIFRKSGVRSRILTLRQRIETNQELRFNELNKNNEFSIYDIADLVKMWFRELKPVPLMTKELIKLISNFLNSSSARTTATTTKAHHHSTITRSNTTSQQQERIISSASSRIETTTTGVGEQITIDATLIAMIDSITTTTHRALLYKALNFLAQVSARCDVNQMTSQNLAICLTPSLCATESDQNSILNDQKALEYCIDNHKILFGR